MTPMKCMKKYEIDKKDINCKNKECQDVQNYQRQKQLNSQRYKLALKTRFLSLLLGCDHTQSNFKSAFYRSNIADNNSFVIADYSTRPNPFSNSTAIYFQHNKANQDLDVVLDIE